MTVEVPEREGRRKSHRTTKNYQAARVLACRSFVKSKHCSVGLECVPVEQDGEFEDLELPTEVRDQCRRVPRKRRGVSLLGSAANMQYCMRAGLGQAAEPPTQTYERVTMQSVERFACDQHDHVSFAQAWMLMSKGIAHTLDCDFRLVQPAVMAPLQRRLEGGENQNSPSMRLISNINLKVGHYSRRVNALIKLKERGLICVENRK